ncbi:MAG: hypothetical protein LBJ42_00485 [Holosporales bacterium]|nr:hypothetical protein [Holosporales bacterium]
MLVTCMLDLSCIASARFASRQEFNELLLSEPEVQKDAWTATSAHLKYSEFPSVLFQNPPPVVACNPSPQKSIPSWKPYEPPAPRNRSTPSEEERQALWRTQKIT